VERRRRRQHQGGTHRELHLQGRQHRAREVPAEELCGTVVQATTAPIWLTSVKGSATSAPVDESVYSASGDRHTTHRYDSTAQQYIYNWKTGTGRNYWHIGVSPDDGQTYYVNIGLR